MSPIPKDFDDGPVPVVGSMGERRSDVCRTRGRVPSLIRSRSTTVFLLMDGTIEERVTSMVVTRAVKAKRALDASRGVDVSQTVIGLALGALVIALDGTTAGRCATSVLMEDGARAGLLTEPPQVPLRVAIAGVMF